MDQWQQWKTLFLNSSIIFDGFANTLIIFFASTFFALILGVILLFLLERKERSPIRRILMLFIDLMRMLPILILVYLVYYGLPRYGIRFSAWTAGIVGLSLYHGAYIAEILRGLRATLPRGQSEAALSHGYTKFKMMRYIVIPQLFIKSGPLIGNQLIYLLKDTAFLSIITVEELTWAASSIQSIYFIPIQAFVVAIALYWVMSLIIGRLVRQLDKIAQRRGLGHGA